MISEIRSGGQTGVDRAALDAAMAHGVPCAGWIPRHRRAEDGRVPARYTALVETPDDAYETRTAWNVRDADATLVITLGSLSGGSLLTVEIAARLGRPHLVIDLDAQDPERAVAAVHAWLAALPQPVRLNVAGPRAGHAPGIYDRARALLDGVLNVPDTRRA
ncbi:MAG TPA: putative molybdenum carrier protein [Gemmatimonadales bacterium]|jgi:hypothetical protein